MTTPANRPKRAAQQDVEKTIEPKIPKLSDSAAGDSGSCHCLIYIDDRKISSGHLAHLKTVAKRKGFPLADTIRSRFCSACILMLYKTDHLEFFF